MSRTTIHEDPVAMTHPVRTILARQDVAGLAFTSIVFEPGAVLGWHSHPKPYLSFVQAGSYTERLGGLTRQCDPSTILLHSAGERHANVFHDRAVRLLRVEATDSALLDLRLNGASSDGC